MDYMRYHRYIILLDGENREFALRDEACKGHLKIETGNNRGALRCRVENLKPMQKNEYVYKLIFFGKKRERTIYTIIGSLNINRSGAGETYFRFNPTDVDGEGHSYEDFSSIVVAAASVRNEKEPLHPVLSGETENFGGDSDDRKQGGGQSGFFGEERVEFEPEEKSEPEEIAQWNKPATEARKTYNRFYNEHLMRTCEHMCQVADFYEELNPFDEDVLHAKWRKVQSIQSIPIVSPGAIYFARQYNHYLFGAKEAPNGYAGQYYIAVPGRFTEKERPDDGRSGFSYWQPIKGAKQESGAYGYWIVAIDPLTGDIVDPE